MQIQSYPMKEKILGKPKDEDEGKDMLEFLSGKEHEVITGIAIIKANSNIKDNRL